VRRAIKELLDDGDSRFPIEDSGFEYRTPLDASIAQGIVDAENYCSWVDREEQLWTDRPGSPCGHEEGELGYRTGGASFHHALPVQVNTWSAGQISVISPRPDPRAQTPGISEAAGSTSRRFGDISTGKIKTFCSPAENTDVCRTWAESKTGIRVLHIRMVEI
jgi:hypothetical protein